MHLDVRDLRTFYYRSALGRAAQRAVRDQLRAWWPDAKGQTVAGFGFAVPLLRPYLKGARRVIALMPAPQGVMPWPAGQPNISVLCDDMLWPLDTGVVDRLVVMHGLETSQNGAAVLEEAYRVLGPGGHMCLVLPNRSGMWSRSDNTPFGFGRPYSASQLEAQLRDHGFRVERQTTVLHQPPSGKRFWLKTGPLWEQLGRMVPILVGGVLMVDVVKQIPAPKRPGLSARVAKPLSVLEGLGKAEPARGTIRETKG
ncbi:MAG: class I SAM-dependent methyltransferase [Maritimibacter sp.]